MEKAPFNITAKQDGNRAVIRITGVIGWNNDAERFRLQVDALVAAGVKDVHLYLNGAGGSCFDAAEIVNILLSSFSGFLTGEGGALVASAYTFIAQHCEMFTMPENGLFMVHKPSGGVSGTASEVLAYHKLLANIETTYLNKYKEKSTDVVKFEKRWNTGDWWLTAQEAQKAGFITTVRGVTKIDSATAQAIVACGYPADETRLINTNINTTNDMDIKVMAAALGLPETATDAEIQAQIAKNNKAAAELERFKTEQEAKNKAELEAKAEAKLDQAALEHKFKADARATWRKKLLEDFDGVSAMLDSIAAAVKPTAGLKPTPQGSPTATTDKTFEELQDSDPDALAVMQASDPAAYDTLFDEYLRRNKLKK